jgi:hypothetical protein
MTEHEHQKELDKQERLARSIESFFAVLFAIAVVAFLSYGVWLFWCAD